MIIEHNSPNVEVNFGDILVIHNENSIDYRLLIQRGKEALAVDIENGYVAYYTDSIEKVVSFYRRNANKKLEVVKKISLEEVHVL